MQTKATVRIIPPVRIPMKTIDLRTASALDSHVSDRMVLAQIERNEETLRITLGEEQVVSHEWRLWEHTVYELENLACALRYAADGGIPKGFVLSLDNVLIGPEVRLWPAVVVEVGHPGISEPGRGVMFHIFVKEPGIVKRRRVFCSATFGHYCQEAIFEVADTIRLSEEVYELARSICVHLDSEPWNPY